MIDKFTLTVNSQPYAVEAARDTPHLDVLRNVRGLSGPPFGCVRQIYFTPQRVKIALG